MIRLIFSALALLVLMSCQTKKPVPDDYGYEEDVGEMLESVDKESQDPSADHEGEQELEEFTLHNNPWGSDKPGGYLRGSDDLYK